MTTYLLSLILQLASVGALGAGPFRTNWEPHFLSAQSEAGQRPSTWPERCSAATETLLSEAQDAEQRKPALAEAVAALSPRERTIVEARFLAEQPSTLDELAKIFRISRERIRQIEQSALQRIKTKISEALAHRGAALASSS